MNKPVDAKELALDPAKTAREAGKVGIWKTRFRQRIRHGAGVEFEIELSSGMQP